MKQIKDLRAKIYHRTQAMKADGRFYIKLTISEAEEVVEALDAGIYHMGRRGEGLIDEGGEESGGSSGGSNDSSHLDNSEEDSAGGDQEV